MGPNEKRLIVTRMSSIAVPPGGGVVSALSFLSSAEKMRAGAAEAAEWVREAISVVRSAPDNIWETDEEICGEILRRIAERHGALRAVPAPGAREKVF